MGAPGWPELAFCTASMARVRMVSMHSRSMSASWGFEWAAWGSAYTFIPLPRMLKDAARKRGRRAPLRLTRSGCPAAKFPLPEGEGGARAESGKVRGYGAGVGGAVRP